MQLSVLDLSKHLGVTTDTIERWVRQGRLPVSRRGDTYSFHLDELKKWAARQHLKLNISEKEQTPPKKDSRKILLADCLELGGVIADIKGQEVPEIIADAVERMDVIPDAHKNDLVTRLLEREQALSTGIGNGIAIPHPRHPLDYLESPVVCAGFLSEAVDYKALDNKPVSTLFFILCPQLQYHLHLLSVLSFCLRNNSFRSFLNTKPSAHQLKEKIGLLEQTYAF